MTVSRRYWIRRVSREFSLPLRQVVRHVYGMTAQQIAEWYGTRKKA